MKNNVVLRLVPWVMVFVAMFSLYGCIEETISISPTSDNSSFSHIYSYNWTDKENADTLIFECNQQISYLLGDKDVVLYPKALVKIYPKKDTISFEANKKGDVIYNDEITKEKSSGSHPIVNEIEKEFYFTDGQIVKAEIYYENDNIVLDNINYELPCIIVDTINFIEASFDEIANEENIYFVNLDFSFDWHISSENKRYSENISTFYIKNTLLGEDEFLNVLYANGFIWHSDTQFSVFVEKTEIWRDAGEQKTTYNSPILDFYIYGKENKSLIVDNFNFEKTENYFLLDVEKINSDGWNIKKYINSVTVSQNNGIQSFINEFEFPVFEIILSIDGKLFNFDLAQKQEVTSKIVSENDKNTLITNLYASILDRKFESNVYTQLELDYNNGTQPPVVVPNPEPDPEPDPDPDPEPEKYKYGKIVNYSITAVYDLNSSKTDGKITKKCVMLRFENGYLWGVCDYNEDFPEDFQYTTSGYSAFNSVARDKVNAPYELAKAVDTSDAIIWYSENNKIIAGIDIYSCMFFGWENILNGKYSAFINSYSATYSDNKFTITLTAPSGASKTFYSE